jgi:hypothetical protein
MLGFLVFNKLSVACTRSVDIQADPRQEAAQNRGLFKQRVATY